jgi:hypothetical protein
MDGYQMVVIWELARGIKHWKDTKEMTSQPQLDNMMELLRLQQDYFLEKQSTQAKL